MSPDGGNLSSLHIGNSLTDTIVGRLDAVAHDAGFALELHRFTIPGAGTQWLWDHPTSGIGEADIYATLRSTRFDHLSVEPFPNQPCTPAGNGSDADYVGRFYALARQANPDVFLWIYQEWPHPRTWNDCFSMGANWTDPPWVPPIANPTTWEDAVTNHVAYQEAVREALIDANPGTIVGIVPAGLALRALKRETEAGRVPGWNDFFASTFDDGGTDLHLTPAGRWFVTFVFYATMFQESPAGLGLEMSGLRADQAAILGEIAWDAVNRYALSGVNR